jgi:predicted RecA/RadA family phage recombinase
MKNFVKGGSTVNRVAPSGGVVSGTAYKIGQRLIVATHSAAQGANFEGELEGVFTLPKLSAQAWTVDALLYWDDSAKHFTTVATGKLLAGTAEAIAANPSATGLVRLINVPRPNDP